jgi:hypothetical protein
MDRMNSAFAHKVIGSDQLNVKMVNMRVQVLMALFLSQRNWKEIDAFDFCLS